MQDVEAREAYFPEEQMMQEDAVVGSLAYFPASQLRHKESPTWREGVAASSARYRPEGQFVQLSSAVPVVSTVVYLPAAHMSHDVLGECE